MVLYNPKTKTLFQRGDNFKVIADINFVTDTRFRYIRDWLLTEKMDGTSVIISTDGYESSFHGRTAKSQFTPAMSEFLRIHANAAAGRLMYHGIQQADIYAELFGEGIQGNPHGMEGMHLRVFDVRIGDYWLDFDNVKDVAQKAGLKTVRALGTADILRAMEYVRDEQVALTGTTGYVEGVVARTREYLYDNQGNRLTWKLKRKDF